MHECFSVIVSLRSYPTDGLVLTPGVRHCTELSRRSQRGPKATFPAAGHGKKVSCYQPLGSFPRLLINGRDKRPLFT